jgi:hypothetical protein
MARTLTKDTAIKNAAGQVFVSATRVEIPEIQGFVNQAIERFLQIEDLRLRQAFLTVFSDKVRAYILKDFDRANVLSPQDIKGWYRQVKDVTELRSGLEPAHKAVWQAVASSLDSMVARLF